MIERIYLIGYRGTGKSTVGRKLAERLGWRFLDADVVLVERVGKTIAEIFRTEGEGAFRDWESRVLADLSTEPRAVIACGGGVILREQNRDILKRSGQVIWLRADVDTIAARLDSDPLTASQRPNLSVGGREEIRDLLARREPLYQQSANRVIDATISPEAIVTAILAESPVARIETA